MQKGIARQAQGPTDPYFAAISAATPTADAVALDSESSSSESTLPDWGEENEQGPSTEAATNQAESSPNNHRQSVDIDRRQVKSLALDHKAQ